MVACIPIIFSNPPPEAPTTTVKPSRRIKVFFVLPPLQVMAENMTCASRERIDVDEEKKVFRGQLSRWLQVNIVHTVPIFSHYESKRAIYRGLQSCGVAAASYRIIKQSKVFVFLRSFEHLQHISGKC